MPLHGNDLKNIFTLIELFIDIRHFVAFFFL